MNFKTIFFLLFFLVGLKNSYAEEVTSCSALEKVSSYEYSALNDLKKGPINFCDETIYHEGKKRMTSADYAEKNKRINHLRKECKKKARAYKKAVAKKLLGKFKLKQGFEALFTSKKKLMKTKIINGKKTKNQKEILSNLSADELSAIQNGSMSKDEFSALVMKNIREEIPDIDNLVLQSKKLNNFSHTFEEEESFPVNIVIKNDAGKSCVLKVDEFPEEEEFIPKTCELCKTEVIQNNFTNDCSYMVGTNLSEKEARKLVGAHTLTNNGEKLDSHCNHNMKGIQNDMTEINNTVDKLCRIAKEGLTPKFNIETSRNEYSDKTKNLALKRGEFTQKFIFSRLNHKDGPCQFGENEELPEWLQDEEEFKKVVTISYPEYKREGAILGDYGPKPDATQGEIQKEKEYLGTTLSYELNEIEKKKKSYERRQEEIQKELLNIKSSVENQKKLFLGVKKTKIGGASVIDGINEQTLKMTNIARTTQELYEQKKKLLQEESDLMVRIKGLEVEKNSSKYKKLQDGSFSLVAKLDEFYKSNRSDRNKWDRELFDQFKMARITGDVAKINEFGLDESLITPELNAMLKTLVQVDSFVCELKPLETSKLSLEGVLKFPLKIITAATLPVAGVVAGLGGTFNWMCRGCLTPGSEIPKISFRFKQNMPYVWSDMKDAAKTYVTWGGALDVKGRRITTRHELADYSSKKYGQRNTNEASCDDSEILVGKSVINSVKETSESQVNKN